MNSDPHMETWNLERSEVGDMKWLTWVNKAEVIMGKSLDGNQGDDGYSLDFAYESFLKGMTPQQYVAKVRS